MNLRSAIAFLLVSSAFGSSARPAMADYVIFAVEGEITSVEDDDKLLGGAVTVGSPFAGTYTFDPLTPDSDPHPRRGLYWDAIIDISGNVAGVPFSGPIGALNAIDVQDDFTSSTLDEYYVRADITMGELGLDMLVGLLDGTGNMFASDELPVSPPEIASLDTRRLMIFDSSETIPVSLAGDVASLTVVPEPMTLTMIVLGTLLVARPRRISGTRQTRPGGSWTPKRGCTIAILLPLGVACFLSSSSTALGTDCNGNGVEDATELADCPDIEVVFVIDTSESMNQFILGVCAAIDEAMDDLAQDAVTVYSELLSIEAGTACSCSSCESTLPNVHDRYGDEAIGYPEVPRLGLCNPGTDGDEEDWAPATAIVAANKSWTEGGIRIIVPISDEGPRCGDPVSDPGSDRDAIEAAIDGIHTFSSVESQSAVFITYSGGQFVHAQNKEAL